MRITALGMPNLAWGSLGRVWEGRGILADCSWAAEVGFGPVWGDQGWGRGAGRGAS